MKVPRSSFTNKSWKVVIVGLSHSDKENDPPMTLASNFTNILLEYHHIAERQANYAIGCKQTKSDSQRWEIESTKKGLRQQIWNTRNFNYKH